MRIQKDNIVIRSATIEDAIWLNQWWNDGRVMEHAGFPHGLGEALEDTMDTIRNWQSNLSQLCMIEIDDKLVGELNYKIKDDKVAYPGWKICDFSYQNQGYGLRIIMILFGFLFTDELINSKFVIDKIVWDTMLENKRAHHVYEKKIGARKVGVRKDFWQDQTGKWRTAVVYEITKEDFFNRIVSSAQVKNKQNDNGSKQEIKSFQEYDYKSFVNMFNSYLLHDLQMELQYPQIEEICAEIREMVRKQVVFLDLMKINNRNIGFIIYQIDSPRSDWCQKEGFGFIREVYIEKDLRGQGLGKLLSAHVEQSLREKNVVQIYLTADNCGAFWNQCGFTKTHEIGYKNQDPIYVKRINL
jgi:RimJ/RimL family protein N-acetyltransferase/GNAT superfamily N-acetyltransferase